MVGKIASSVGKKLSSAAVKEAETKTKIKNSIEGAASRQLGRLANTVPSGVTRQLKKYARFEVSLVVLLSLFPFLLIFLNGWPTGDYDSISAHHAMRNPFELWAFYVPLTMAAMLLMVNRFVRKESWYNVYLGAALLGLTLFNHKEFSGLHNFFTFAFFVGNIVVILRGDTGLFSKRNEGIFDWILVGVMGIFAVLWKIVPLFTQIEPVNMFFMEWISLLCITLHFILMTIVIIKKESQIT